MVLRSTARRGRRLCATTSRRRKRISEARRATSIFQGTIPISFRAQSTRCAFYMLMQDAMEKGSKKPIREVIRSGGGTGASYVLKLFLRNGSLEILCSLIRIPPYWLLREPRRSMCQDAFCTQSTLEKSSSGAALTSMQVQSHIKVASVSPKKL